jgi:hypothetical protein
VDFEITALDHVQVAMPPGREFDAERFYCGPLGFERMSVGRSVAVSRYAAPAVGAAPRRTSTPADTHEARGESREARPGGSTLGEGPFS